MPKKFTRRRLVCAVAPIAAVGPLARLADQASADSHQHHHGAMGHAAMIGDQTPAPGGPNDLTALLVPPAALPHKPGRLREYTLTAVDKRIEVAQGVF